MTTDNEPMNNEQKVNLFIVTLYHGTDITSALDILNNGLNVKQLQAKQKRPLQLGLGWYAALESEVAEFFGSLATNITGEHYTIIQMSLSNSDLDYLFATKQARQEVITNVHFVAEQIWFSPTSFDFLNERATFSPY